jgi:hypothetical protein
MSGSKVYLEKKKIDKNSDLNPESREIRYSVSQNNKGKCYAISLLPLK